MGSQYYPQSQTSAGTILAYGVVFIICVVLYLNWSQVQNLVSNLTKPPAQPYIAPNAAAAAAYNTQLAAAEQVPAIVQTITNPSVNVQNYMLLLYPHAELTGWDLEGKSQSPFQPNNTDGSVNYVYMEDFMFLPDIVGNGSNTLSWTEMDGSKLCKFATVSGGQKKFFFNSFAVSHHPPQSFVMMITTLDILGNPVNSGFMLSKPQDCRNISQLLDLYPELEGGNNGIWWDRNIEGMTWYLCALNIANFNIKLNQKLDTCLDMAAGIDVSAQSGEDQTLGLHYADGTRITGTTSWQGSTAQNMATGRWYYDANCDAVVDPSTNKQAYKKGSGGWGQTCADAYNFCGFDTGTVIGFADWGQINLQQIGSSGKYVPKNIGLVDVPNSYSIHLGNLSPSQQGWIPTTSAPVPANAKTLLTGTAPTNAPSTFTSNQELGQTSRFTSEQSGVDSLLITNNKSRRSGYIDAPRDGYNVKYMSCIS